jgi:dolichol-phosphate mannosyltransferase
MFNNEKISVVIPCYRSSTTIEKVIQSIPDFVDNIILIDDKCPEKSGNLIENLNISKVVVLFHHKNKGVGGATITGYNYAIEIGSDIVVKIDSDCQMDPANMTYLLNPIINYKYAYSKGNRFGDLRELRSMPSIRIFGNSILSFFVKVVSGYWNIMDPTNGYTAISSYALSSLNLDKLSNRYYFETSVLVNLNIMNFPVKDVSMKPIYAGEKSSLNIFYEFFRFPVLLIKSLFIRIFYKYFLYDFNMGSIYILIGPVMLIYGAYLGTSTWYENSLIGLPSPVGTILISVVNIILGVQFILQAISIDISNTPKVKSDN